MMNNKWAIDVVLLGAIKTARGEADEFRRKHKVREELNMVDDQKVFWQRVGQRLITSTFGVGATVASMPENEFGKPWKFTDSRSWRAIATCTTSLVRSLRVSIRRSSTSPTWRIARPSSCAWCSTWRTGFALASTSTRRSRRQRLAAAHQAAARCQVC